MTVHLPIDSAFSHEHILACPKCKPENADAGFLHLGKVICEDETVQLRYHCEICGKASWLCLEQHKGNTLVHWAEQ